MENYKKQVDWLKYLNTSILSVILGFTILVSRSLSIVKEDNIETQKELLRLKTIQDIDVSSMKAVELRVGLLELNYTEELKKWVENNYIRKPQK